MVANNGTLNHMDRQRKSSGAWNVAWRRLRRNKAALIGAIIAVLVVFVAVFSPWIATRDPNDTSAFLSGETRQPPSWKYLLGTDSVGYDIFSRLVYGARVSLFVGLVSMTIAASIGIAVGSVAGYYGGKVEVILMRITDIFLTMPMFLIVLALVKVLSIAITGTALEEVFAFRLILITLVIGCFRWASIARVCRAEFLKNKRLDFVEAAKCLGASSKSIIFKHILPNALSPIIVVATVGIAWAILTESSISFLGFGDPTVPSWGGMLSAARETMRTVWWAALSPGLALFLTTLGLNLLSIGLDDVLNPRLR